MRGLILLAAGAASIATSPAFASTFAVNPVIVKLSPSAPSALITVTNQDVEPLRLQVSSFAWAQTDAGEMKLEATEDIVHFPAMLTLAPGESRKVRVGAVSGFAAMEKSYRIFVEELPPIESPDLPRPPGIRILTRMGIPVFLEAADKRPPVARMQLAVVDARTLEVTVLNPGSVHYISKAVRVSGASAAGEPLFELDLAGWYVLPAGKRVYRVEVPGDACKSVGALRASMELAAGAPVMVSVDAPVLDCGS